MGKTEIFKRVVNRLFFEQEHRDPEAVVPVYYSFPDLFKDRWDFSAKYVCGKCHTLVCGVSFAR
ncbi:MAG: hypothetical protein DRR08_33015 [Candidatus Parabeggiatoa sp. nov. 2]|nr:MAG: hypothetical protein DRR08_33015 [Gammaproteobacteria bacterium]